jgi:selenocysteine lyase/cysteine desulfurase
VPIVICDVSGIYPDDEGAILDDNYGIAIRTGLHCAPLLHADLGTANREAIRFSLGFNSTESDIESAIEAMAEIGGKARR